MPGTVKVTSEGTLFVVRFSGTYTDEDFAGYLHELEVLIEARTAEFGLFVTEADARMPSHRHVWRQAKWLERHKGNMVRLRKIAFVMPSPLLRGALLAVFKFQPSPVDYAVFRDEAEALGWLLG